jgi:uroporphyrinogen decarboxylase
MSKRDFVFAAFDNQPVERVPVGFWFHFVPEGFASPTRSHILKNVIGHQAYYDDFQPDFVKLMSDGFFGYPNDSVARIEKAADLDQVTASNPTEWIDGQVALVKDLVGLFGDEVATFYNVFAPGSYFDFLQQYSLNDVRLRDFVKENPAGVAHALGEISKDIAQLARRVITEGGADGIYLSVRNVQGVNQTKEEYLATVAPSELAVLDAANQVSQYNLLHICGYEGAKNDLSFYAEYPAKVINFASVVEGVSLGEAKKLFGGKAIIGGFGQTKQDLLYTGTKEEITAYTNKLLDEAGTTGIILGADCTIPGDTPYDHLNWVREAAIAYGRK